MDWQTLSLLLIFIAVLCISYMQIKIPKDLVFFIGGATTLLIGLTPAKEFVLYLTDAILLGTLFLFVLFLIGKDLVFDRMPSRRSFKDIVELLPDDLWPYAFSGFFFAAAFGQTALPELVGASLFAVMQGNPFLIVAFLLAATYLIVQFLPPLFVLLAIFPFSQAALQFSMVQTDVQVAAAMIGLFAAMFSSLNTKTREKIQIKVRLPLLIFFFLLSAFLIPQVWL